MLVANDSNFKRAQMLVHQLHRLPSPTLMVINLDASNMPNILDENKRPVYFDRVLADVPCSGDGTSRKNPGIWRDWRATNGLGLHGYVISTSEAVPVADNSDLDCSCAFCNGQ